MPDCGLRHLRLVISQPFERNLCRRRSNRPFLSTGRQTRRTPPNRASPSNRKDALQPPTTWPVGCSGPGRSREMWSRERTHQPSTTSPQLSRHRYRGRGGPPACWPSRCGLLRLPWPRPRPCWPLTPKPRACPPRPSESAYGRGGPPGSAGRGHPDERRRIYDAAGIRAGLQTFELRTEPVRASLSVGFLCVGEGTKLAIKPRGHGQADFLTAG